jgi:hypothetical protein
MAKRYQRGNHHLYIEEEQTKQWPQNTKGVIKSVDRRIADDTMATRYQRGNQNLYIEDELTTQWPQDTKGVIRICISKKSRRSNGQKIPKG